MSANASPRRTGPSGATTYYLGRPASIWLTIITGRPEAPDHRR